MTALPSAIVDSHQHFWTGMHAFAFSDYMPNDYLADAAPLGTRIRASIFAECNTQYDRTLPRDLQATGETRFAAEVGRRCAAQPLRCAAAIVGHADPLAETPFEHVVDAQLAAGAGRLRKIRRSAAWDPDDRFNYQVLRTREHMLLDERFTRALCVLALAEELAPWLEHLIECFGPERCLFESNFPVDKAHCDLSVLVEAYSLALGSSVESERTAIFAGNAARLYQLALEETV